MSFWKLRWKIKEKYGTQREFANVLQVSRLTVNYKLNGKVQFLHSDILTWCKLLDISKEEIPEYFF